MITVLLQDKNDNEIARASEPSNSSYLIKDMDDPKYPYLSELSEVSPDVFGPSDMADLIAELEIVRSGLTAPRQTAHLDDIIRLARMCQENADYVLMFTPFGSFLDSPIKTNALRNTRA